MSEYSLVTLHYTNSMPFDEHSAQLRSHVVGHFLFKPNSVIVG